MSKAVEAQAYRFLARYVEEKLPGASLKPTMHKGKGESEGIADAVLEYDGQKVHIEIKACSKKAFGTNIRFTHQTIAKAQGHDLIVALITNVADPEKTSVTFFRLGAVQDSIIVEPHFIVQYPQTTGHHASLDTILRGETAPLNLSSLLDTAVRSHMGRGAQQQDPADGLASPSGRQGRG